MAIILPAAPAEPRMLLLGPCQLHADGVVHFVPERRFQLLVLLALQQGEWVTRDRLAQLLWPDHPASEGRRNLRKVVFAARAVHGVRALEANEHALRWAVDSDLIELARAVREERFASAARLRRGAALSGLVDAESNALAENFAAERTRLEHLWHMAALAELRSLPDAQARAEAACRLLEVDACDESAATALIAAQLALGRGTDAQATYRRYARRLADELGVEPSQALRELLRDASAAAHTVLPLTVGDAQPATAPAEPAAAAFVGRRLELAELVRALAAPEGRVLTVLGPGGIGKSRLARQVMRGQVAGFEDGWRWIELADLVDVAGVVPRIASVLGMTLVEGKDPVEPLMRHLGHGRWTLVLDNAEHIDSLPALLQRLLDGAPGLRLLVTSRERLHLRGERVLPLAGLSVPDEESRDLEAASVFDAVRLFVLRAGAAQHGFRLADHLGAVIVIVEAVGGMPLAIELAAGWVRLLPPAQVAQGLRSSIDLLERDPAALEQPARPEHASLRAVLEGTWRLLAPRERSALSALSVFEGGFTRAAALAVADCSLPLLSSLVDKSLVAVDEAGRFALHPVVAAYATERLAEDSRRAAQSAVRHAAHLAEVMSFTLPAPDGDARERLAAVDRELANVLVALRHAVVQGPDTVFCALVSALRGFYESRGRLVEGLGVLRPLLAMPWLAQRAAWRAQAELRAAVSWLLYRKGDLEDARAIAEAGIAVAQAASDRRLWAVCLRALASSLSAQGCPQQARPHFEQALALYRELGDRPAIATALGDLGVVEKKLGHYEAALTHYRAALNIDREIGQATGIAIRLNNIANVHVENDDWAGARQAFEDGLRHLGPEGTPWVTAYLEYGLGVSMLELGAPSRAQRHLEAARRRAAAADLPHMAVAAAVALARVAIAGGRLGEGLQGLRSAAAACAGPDDIEERLSLALYYGEWLRAAGRDAQAGLAWRVVEAHAAADAGLRRTSRRWTDSLAAAALAAVGSQARSATLDDVLDALRDEQPWPEGLSPAPDPGDAEETSST